MFPVFQPLIQSNVYIYTHKFQRKIQAIWMSPAYNLKLKRNLKQTETLRMH